MHFRPMSWLIRSDDLPRVLNVAIDATESLMKEHHVCTKDGVDDLLKQLKCFRARIKKWDEKKDRV